MNLDSIKEKLQNASIFHSENEMLNHKTVIGYEKKFRWAWFATQLNTFIVATDFGEETVDVPTIEKHLTESFNFAKKNYRGWPRGLQSGLGAICILISSNITADAKEYCQKLKSGKKWSGFSIPIAYNPETKEYFQFLSNPMWGAIYYPHFRKLIDNLK
ncbi:MAG: hypothetical protein MK212_18480 [Saprospiraceae bacterium]|nr:hypothetical protein [Saprospiraceae bacterium]